MDPGSLLDEAFGKFDSGDAVLAVALYGRAMELSTPGSREEHLAIHGLAFSAAHAGKFGLARGLYLGLLFRARKAGDRRGEAVALHQLGMAERLAGDYERARRFCKAEMAVRAGHLSRDRSGIAACMYEIGFIAFLERDYAAAASELERALGIAEEGADQMVIACCLRALGQLVVASGKTRDGLQLLERAACQFRLAGDERGAAEVMELIGQGGTGSP